MGVTGKQKALNFARVWITVLRPRDAQWKWDTLKGYKHRRRGTRSFAMFAKLLMVLRPKDAQRQQDTH
eukprot:scaffold157644_cov20-Tisochrysis_lutea.AAC.3